MSRKFISGQHQYLRYTGDLGVSGYPVSISMLFRCSGATPLMWWSEDGGSKRVQTDQHADGAMDAYFNGSPSNGYMEPSRKFSLNGWHHQAVVLYSSTSRYTVIDAIWGSGAALNSATIDWHAMSYIELGGNTREPRYGNCEIAEVAIWEAYQLTAAQVRLLSMGFRPDCIGTAPHNYWPLAGTASPEPDIVGSKNLTLYGDSAPAQGAQPVFAIAPPMIDGIVPGIGPEWWPFFLRYLYS